MPQITLDLSDAAELAETLAFLANWLSGSQKQILADSFAAFVGHPAYNTATLCADLHRFACVHSRGAVNWRQAAAGSGGFQGFPESALRMASSAVMPWAAAESR